MTERITLTHSNGRVVTVSSETAKDYAALGWTEHKETEKKEAEDGAVRKPRSRQTLSKKASDNK